MKSVVRIMLLALVMDVGEAQSVQQQPLIDFKRRSTALRETGRSA